MSVAEIEARLADLRAQLQLRLRGLGRLARAARLYQLEGVLQTLMEGVWAVVCAKHTENFLSETLWSFEHDGVAVNVAANW